MYCLESNLGRFEALSKPSKLKAQLNVWLEKRGKENLGAPQLATTLYFGDFPNGRRGGENGSAASDKPSLHTDLAEAFAVAFQGSLSTPSCNTPRPPAAAYAKVAKVVQGVDRRCFAGVALLCFFRRLCGAPLTLW